MLFPSGVVPFLHVEIWLTAANKSECSELLAKQMTCLQFGILRRRGPVTLLPDTYVKQPFALSLVYEGNSLFKNHLRNK